MKQYALSLLAAGLLLLAGCKKEADLVDCDLPLSTSTLAKFTAKYGAPAQTFTFNSSSGGSFTSALGNRIFVGWDTFEMPDGSPLAPNTPVTLEFREIETKANMVLSDMPTTSNGRLLESGGEYYFKATAGNRRLKVKKTGAVEVLTALRPSATRNSNMQLFFGQTTPNGFNWLPAPSQGSLSRLTATRDSTNSAGTFFQYYLSLSNDSLGWVNCDAFVDVSPTTTVTVTAKGPDIDSFNTAIYLVFTNRNSVQSWGTETLKPGELTRSYTGVPVGEAVSVVVFRNVDDKYYFGRQDGTVGNVQSFAPALREVTEAELVAEIRRL